MGRMVAQVSNTDPDRLSRVLDAKYRSIGVDVAALQKQEQDRKAHELVDKERDMAYGKLAQQYDEQIRIKEHEAQKLRKALLAEEAEFQSKNQKKSTRREWDLNRPDALQLECPARTDDADQRCGTSSLQMFTGEDLTAGGRRAAQHDQCKSWWAQQAELTNTQRAAEAAAEAAAAAAITHGDAVQHAAMVSETAARRRSAAETAAHNAALAAHRAAARADAEARGRAAAAAELKAAAADPLLIEDPLLAVSAVSKDRVRPDHWKGMSTAELAAITEEQFRQQEERKAARRAAAEAEAAWARSVAEADAMVYEQQRVADLFTAKQNALRAAFVRGQACQDKERASALQATYAGKIAPEFFQQFGTSHR